MRDSPPRYCGASLPWLCVMGRDSRPRALGLAKLDKAAIRLRPEYCGIEPGSRELQLAESPQTRNLTRPSRICDVEHARPVGAGNKNLAAMDEHPSRTLVQGDTPSHSPEGIEQFDAILKRRGDKVSITRGGQHRFAAQAFDPGRYIRSVRHEDASVAKCLDAAPGCHRAPQAGDLPLLSNGWPGGIGRVDDQQSTSEGDEESARPERWRRDDTYRHQWRQHCALAFETLPHDSHARVFWPLASIHPRLQ
jgi:hypothetical protein